MNRYNNFQDAYDRARLKENVQDSAMKGIRAAFPEAMSVSLDQVHSWDGSLGVWKAVVFFKDGSSWSASSSSSVGAGAELTRTYQEPEDK